MRLKGLFLAFGLGLASVGYAAGIEDSLEYYDTDDFSNAIYFAKGGSGHTEFIFVNGSRSVGMFSSINISLIQDTKQAAYAFVAAKNIQEMSDNAQFSQEFEVNCDRQRITDKDGMTMRLINMSAFHRTTAAMACSVLESSQ